MLAGEWKRIKFALGGSSARKAFPSNPSPVLNFTLRDEYCSFKPSGCFTTKYMFCNSF